MKLVVIASLLICFAGCASPEKKPTSQEQPAVGEKTESTPINERDFAIILLDGAAEILNLSGSGTIATIDGDVLRIYFDDKEKKTSVIIETGNTTSGEYKISGSINGKFDASVLIIPDISKNLQFPVNLDKGVVKILANGSSGSGTIEGSSVMKGKTYSLKGTFKMKIVKN